MGAIEAISFTVDMNTLFERFVESVVRDEGRRAGWQPEPQAGRRLGDSVQMRPDLVLRSAGGDWAVADAKYERLDPREWRHAVLDQLLAYCVALRLQRGLLNHADAERPRTQTVRSAGITLGVVGVDLAPTHCEVLRQTRDAARLLISHAHAHGGRQ